MKIFRHAARNKDFVFTAELFLRPDSNAETIAAQVDLLREHVDGLLLTDNQGGRLHPSPLALASLVIANGADPILQLACRNRNRIALLAELLGAAAVGVTSLMLVRGDHVPDGFEPRPKAVFDVDAGELIAMASRIKADEHLAGLPDLYLGSVFAPHAADAGWQPRKLTRKAESGTQFVISNVCMDPDLVEHYLPFLVAAGIPRRMNVMITLAVLSSADDARWLRDSRPGNQVPDSVIERLEAAADPEQEGIRICAEQLRRLAAIPGVSGAHLIATRNLATIPAAIASAGLGPAA